MPLKRPFELPWPPTVGDRVPGWVMPATVKNPFAIDDLVRGKPIVLWFALGGIEAMRAAVAAFAARKSEADACGAMIAGIYHGTLEPLVAIATEAGAKQPLLADEDGSVMQAHGLPQRAAGAGGYFALVIDANVRVAAIVETPDAPVLVDRVLGEVRRLLQADPPGELASFAPVLLIPHVLTPDFCRHLIHVWQTQGNEDSGFMREIDGRTVGVSDYSHKVRRDHFVFEPTLRRKLNELVAFRVRPEIHKAFNFDVTRFEDFKIACYDASRGGYFRAHRDNTTAGTAHRVWAMSINLNTGDYEGGHLRFPEHGPHLYRPETGTAIIFSCSLLHEAIDVTAGQRFVLLGFFYGEREAKIRERLAAQSGTSYRA